MSKSLREGDVRGNAMKRRKEPECKTCGDTGCPDCFVCLTPGVPRMSTDTSTGVGPFEPKPMKFDRKPWMCRCSITHEASAEDCMRCHDSPPWPPKWAEDKWNALLAASPPPTSPLGGEVRELPSNEVIAEAWCTDPTQRITLFTMLEARDAQHAARLAEVEAERDEAWREADSIWDQSQVMRTQLSESTATVKRLEGERDAGLELIRKVAACGCPAESMARLCDGCMPHEARAFLAASPPSNRGETLAQMLEEMASEPCASGYMPHAIGEQAKSVCDDEFGRRIIRDGRASVLERKCFPCRARDALAAAQSRKGER